MAHAASGIADTAWVSGSWVIRTVVAATVVLVAVGLAVLFAPAMGDVDADALHDSVVAEVDGTSLFSRCREKGGDGWECGAYDSRASGAILYTVDVDGRCWTARRTTSSSVSELPKSADGCVMWHDQLGIGDWLR